MRYPEKGIEIRRARVEDAEGIARVHIASWQATYRGIVSDERLDGLQLEERAAMWHDRLVALAMDPPPRQETCYVAADAANVVMGFAGGGKARPLANGDPPEPYDGELYAIYLAPGSERRGVGSRLAHAVASQLATDGVRSLLVWALARNPSRRFYEALGGALVFEQEIVIAGQALPEVGYGWPDIQALIERTTPR